MQTGQGKLSPAQHSPHGSKGSHRPNRHKPNHPDQGRTTRYSSAHSGPSGSQCHRQRKAALTPDSCGPSRGAPQAARSLTVPEPAAARRAGSAPSTSGKAAVVADAPPASPWREGNAPLSTAERRAPPATPRGLRARCLPPALATAPSSEPKPPSPPVDSRPHDPAPGGRAAWRPLRGSAHPEAERRSPGPGFSSTAVHHSWAARSKTSPSSSKEKQRPKDSQHYLKGHRRHLDRRTARGTGGGPADGYTRLPSNAARSCTSALRKRHLRCTVWRLSGMTGSSRASTRLKRASAHRSGNSKSQHAMLQGALSRYATRAQRLLGAVVFQS